MFSSPQNLFRVYLGLVRTGSLEYAETATRLARGCNLSIEELMAAVTEGVRSQYDNFLHRMESGELRLEAPARQLAIAQGYSLGELQTAINLGKRRSRLSR